ncbi:MAG: AAA family ATPase [Candidatus Paceibacterota bacterium]|jgi:type II secretory pathway predicted ATPase ExeA
MQDEILAHFGLTIPLDKVGYYETDRHKELFKDIRSAIGEGKLIALCGLIGSGKTLTLKRLQNILEDDKKVTVSRSLSIEKNTVKLGALLAALFYDLSTEKNIQIPKGVERREREFLELLKKNKRPVVMFIDEAHDLNGNTLIGLKRLIELVEYGDGKLSIILAGHPKLKNDLQRPTMEEIGFRTEVFSLDKLAGNQREYIYWLIASSSQGKVKTDAILDEDALDMFSTLLRTPLQVQRYLKLALKAVYQSGEKRVTTEILESVLSKQLNEIEAILVRNGYRIKDLVDQFDAKPAEIKALFNNTLDPIRATELRDKMLQAGLPL